MKKETQVTSMQQTLVIIEDEKVVNSMLVDWMSKISEVTVTGSAFSGEEGLALCRKCHPDIVLLDIEMPDMCGFEVAESLREEAPETKIAILSGHCDPFCVYQVSRLHLYGFVDKSSPLDNLNVAIRQIASGKRYYAENFNQVKAAQLSEPDAFQKILTPRELSVLILVSGGETDENISARLNISLNTVATHRRNLRLKLNAHSDRNLLAYAQKWGLVSGSTGKSKFRFYSPFVPHPNDGTATSGS
jgi:two-component system response regulator NreC